MASAIELYLLAQASEYPGPWTTVTLANSWGTPSPPNAPLRYRLLQSGIVELQGLLQGGSATSSTVGSLPSGYYNTTYQQQAPVVATTYAGGFLQVSTAGSIAINATSYTLSWVVQVQFPLA